MYGLPLSQPDCKIPSIFQSLYDNETYLASSPHERPDLHNAIQNQDQDNKFQNLYHYPSLALTAIPVGLVIFPEIKTFGYVPSDLATPIQFCK